MKLVVASALVAWTMLAAANGEGGVQMTMAMSPKANSDEDLQCGEGMEATCVNCMAKCGKQADETELLCLGECELGCGCPMGLILDEESGTCVESPSDCTVAPTCPGQKLVFESCATCVRTCEFEGQTICARGCLAVGCVCPMDYIFNELTGECVETPEDCLEGNNDTRSGTELNCQLPLIPTRGTVCNDCNATCTPEESLLVEDGCFCPEEKPYKFYRPDGQVRCKGKNSWRCKRQDKFLP